MQRRNHIRSLCMAFATDASICLFARTYDFRAQNLYRIALLVSHRHSRPLAAVAFVHRCLPITKRAGQSCDQSAMRIISHYYYFTFRTIIHYQVLTYCNYYRFVVLCLYTNKFVEGQYVHTFNRSRRNNCLEQFCLSCREHVYRSSVGQYRDHRE